MYKILIAEDESIERRMLCKTLSRQFPDELTILEAKHGREALELAMAEKPRLAILDIEMPGMTGLEVAREIRRERLNCMILFLTAYDNFEYARRAISVQALDYLLKPYDEEELAVTLEAAMQMSDRLSKNRGFLEGQRKKLSNENFISRAPEAVVAAERDRAEKLEALIANLEESLRQLG